MKRYAWLLVLIGACLVASAAVVIQWYHEQPHATAINDGDFLAIENKTPSTYKHVLMSELRNYAGGFSTNGVPNIYVTNITVINNISGSNAYFTNVYTVYQTNNYTFTTNLFATNTYINYLTNNYLFTTNIFATNVYVNFFTNNYAFITNLYVTNSLILYETNSYSFVTNLFATNTYVNFFTNNYAFITNLYATNTYIQYLTNNYIFTTNLYATNTYINFLTNNYLFTTNLYATNTYINFLTNNYLFTTNLYATNTSLVYITNTYLLTTNVTATGIVYPEYPWPGPTNTLTCGGTNRWTYTAYTPCAVTNAPAYSAGMLNASILSISNASSTNITVACHPSIRAFNECGTNSYILASTKVLDLYIEVGAMGTNAYPLGLSPCGLGVSGTVPIANVTGIKGYIMLTSPFTVDGTGAIMYTNDNRLTFYGQAQFNNAANYTANYCMYFINVPEDFDNTVDWKVERFKFQLGGADTGTHRYIMRLSSVADSSPYSGSFGNDVNIDFAGDANGADGDVETVSNVTLTDWKSNMTVGHMLIILVARDGNDAADTSTVDSFSGPITLSYGVKQ